MFYIFKNISQKEVVKQDLLVNNISKDFVTDRSQWCRMIHLADFT